MKKFGPRSRDRPPYNYSIKIEVFEKHRVEVVLAPQSHRRWPKVADPMIKASLYLCLILAERRAAPLPLANLPCQTPR